MAEKKEFSHGTFWSGVLVGAIALGLIALLIAGAN